MIYYTDIQYSVTAAKAKATRHFNKIGHSTVDQFEYRTKSGIYVFHRRNKISPDGVVVFGKWL